MSTAGEASVIYPTQGILTLLSRAWNLLRANLKDSLIIMLVPMLLMTIFSIVISIPASRNFLTPTGLQQLVLDLLLTLLGIGLGILAFIAWGISSCALVRLYYSAIIQDKPVSAKACWRFVRSVWQPLLAMLLSVAVVLGGFIFLDFLVLFFGMLMSMAAFTALGAMSGITQSLTLMLMLFFFLLLWGFVVLVVMLSLMTVQGFFLIAPFVALSTASQERPSWWQSIREAYRLLFANMPRLILFAIALFCFSLLISMVLNAPVYIWGWFERARLGVGEQHHVPFYILTVMNLWGSLINLILMPYYVSAVTLFWYDGRVRLEGLDLRIWFNQLIRRRGEDPGHYMPQREIPAL